MFFIVRVARLRARLVFGAAFFAAAGLFLAGPAVAQTVINVTDGPSLSAAIAQVDGNASASYVINFQSNITLSNAASNTLKAFNTTSNVTVNGNGFTLDGGSVQRGFFVYSGTVAIENLTVQNTQALGGSGGSAGAAFVGGGGGGLGGALFVASSGIVTISNVTLLSNNASGGSGSGGGGGLGGGSGGGGLGGTGGAAGGGGVGLGANGGGGAQGNNGSAGIVIGASSGGNGVAPGGGSGGANGGGGGGLGGGGGVGGGDGNVGGNGNGGFGGGGGGAGRGPFAGGGGFGGGGGGGGLGGGGGFGGGGGGGEGNLPGGAGGSGGFGGGNGASSGASGGGGGLGGAVFVQSGGSLSIAGTLTINGNTVTPGNAQSGGGGGLAFGSGIFFQGTSGTPTALTFGAGTQLVGDVIADYVGSGGTNPGGGTNAADQGGSLALAKNGAGVLTLSGINTFTGGTTVSGAGLINFSAANNFGSGAITLNGGGLQWAGGNTTDISGRLAAIGANGATFDTNGNNVTLATALTSPSGGGITVANSGSGGALTLTATNTYTGPTTINAGATLAIGNGGTTGSLATSSNVTDNGMLVFDRSDTVSFGNMISGGGAFQQSGAGTLILTNTNTYTGATNVNAGALEVDGSIATSNLTTVNNGGLLMGTGTVGATQVNSGGVLRPGNGTAGTSLTISGSLAFQSGALYLIDLNGAAASKAIVNGTAWLGGAQVGIGSGSTFNVNQKYTILTASGGVSGSFASLIATAPLYKATLSYDPNDVFLTFSLNQLSPLLPAGASTSVKSVAGAIDSFIIQSGGTPPPGFANLSNLTGANLSNALTQIDGEGATGAERGVFDLMNEFLGLMLDPFVNGRGNAPGTGGASGGASGFAPEQQTNLPPEIAQAYAAVFKAPPKANFDERWSAWGTAYGGGNTAQGNAAVGSSTINAATYGVAAGMDYRVSPSTVVGFALAGGGTNWGLANALGTGRSDALQVGGYGITRFGPAYLAGALAFTNNWFTTNRSALGDQLTANFSGQSYGVRVEGGYRVPVWHTLGVTPYAAVLAQDFSTPHYSETDKTGGGFGLSYAAMNATDVRTELGARFDDPTLLYGKPLILFGRLAWAHDFVSNPALNAAFEALPGSSFTVNGAPLPHDSAITSAGSQYFFTRDLSFTAKFVGEFAPASQTYAGSGTLRYTW
jgi:uncharacterized protein with beta-barrel porin domain